MNYLWILGSEFHEDQSVANSIIDSSLSIANLEPLDVLTSSGKIVKIDAIHTEGA